MQLLRTALFYMAFGQLVFIGAATAHNTTAPPKQVTVALSNFAYAPSEIVLKANTPITLHLVNNSTKGHNFSAPEFFVESTVAPTDKSKVVDGVIELEGDQTVDVIVTPTRAGNYSLECTHFMHAMLGMSGEITVQ